MKTFIQLREQLNLIEGRGTINQKGWINYKTKKIVLWNFKNNGKPWHIQFVCNNPKKFGLTEKKILSIIANAGWIDPDEGVDGVPDKETQKNLEYLKSGVHDHQDELRQHLESNGWMEFYNENDRGISGGSRRAATKDLHTAAKVLEKVLSVSSTMEFDRFRQIRLHGSGSTTVHIKDRFAWKTFLTTGKMVKQKSALAAFR
jgi:hypothetical protein